MKKDVSRRIKEIDLLVKFKGESIGEEYFDLKPEFRISDFNAVVTSNTAKFIFIRFKNIYKTLYNYKTSSVEFTKLCNSRLKNLKRILKKRRLSPFCLNYNPGRDIIQAEQEKSKPDLQFPSLKGGKQIRNRVKRNTILKRKVKKKEKEEDEKKKMKEKKNIIKVIKSMVIKQVRKDKFFRSFNTLKLGNQIERLENINIDPSSTAKNYIYGIVTTDFKLSHYQNIRRISQSKRSLDRKKVTNKEKVDFLKLVKSSRRYWNTGTSTIFGRNSSRRKIKSLSCVKKSKYIKKFSEGKKLKNGTDQASTYFESDTPKFNFLKSDLNIMGNRKIERKMKKGRSGVSFLSERQASRKKSKKLKFDRTDTLSIIMNNRSIVNKISKKDLKLNPLSKEFMSFKPRMKRKKDDISKLLQRFTKLRMETSSGFT